MVSMPLELPSLDKKDEEIMLVDSTNLIDGNDNSLPLVHVLESNNFPETGVTMKSLEYSFCIICFSKLNIHGRGSTNIFDTEAVSLAKHESLSSVLEQILGLDLEGEVIESPHVCKKCVKLISHIDALEDQLFSFKQEVLKKYTNTKARLNRGDRVYGELTVSTETNSDDESTLYRITSRGRRRKRGRGRPPNIKKTLEFKEEVQDDLGWISLESNDNLQITLTEDVESDISETVSTILMGADESSAQTEVKSIVSDCAPEVLEVDGLDLDNETNVIQIGGIFVPSVSVETTKNEILPSVSNSAVSSPFRRYKCRFCKIQKMFFAEMRNHLLQEHEERLFECEICEKRERSRVALLSHLEAHALSGRRPYSCDKCPKKYATPRQLKAHIQHHLTRSFSCYFCARKFRSELNLQEHINSHTGYRPYACEICPKSFTSKHILRNHLRTHNIRSRPFKCAVCGKAFMTVHHLNSHLALHDATKDFICESCGKGFATQRGLEIHSVIHSGIKNYQCKVCLKTFARKGEVEDHERIHTGEKPFQCEICGATFSQRSNLASHKKATHLDVKKYRCGQCPKAFKRKRLLVYHVMSAHTGERPHKCKFCSAAFVYPEHYKKHMRIHSGIKPFKCEICGKSFNSRDNKNSHKFTHSDKKQYECVICTMGFMRKPQALIHVDQYHPCDNAEAYIKVNPVSVVDEELGLPKSQLEPTVNLKISPDPEIAALDDQVQLIRAEPHSESLDIMPRGIQIVESDDISRYIIQPKTVDGKNDENVGHFLASLNGQVVELTTDGIERYTELTAEQLSQMAQVVSSTGNETDSSEFRLFQIQIEDDKDPTAAITSSSSSNTQNSVSLNHKFETPIILGNRSFQAGARKVSSRNNEGASSSSPSRAWTQPNSLLNS